MARIDELLDAALRSLPAKPPDAASRVEKKRYSELLSQKIALAIAEDLRQRGLTAVRPAAPAAERVRGAERRMAGGIGAKKVDVTWATEESGLILGISIKTINFRDRRTGNYQKNLANRRGDMLIEAVTLHRRFPYAVLSGMLFLDKGAMEDATSRRRSTFQNAHARLQLFTGRDDPAGRDEQYEKLYVLLLDASPARVEIVGYEVGKPENPISLDSIMIALLMDVANRNPDFYELVDGSLAPVRA